MIKVGMNQLGVTTQDDSVIQTIALATCVGLLIYDEEEHIAYLAHASSYSTEFVDAVKSIINPEKVYKYKVIPGHYYNHYFLYENITKLMDSFSNLKEIETQDAYYDEEEESHDVTFDASTGLFIVKSPKKSR